MTLTPALSAALVGHQHLIFLIGIGKLHDDPELIVVWRDHLGPDLLYFAIQIDRIFHSGLTDLPVGNG